MANTKQVKGGRRKSVALKQIVSDMKFEDRTRTIKRKSTLKDGPEAAGENHEGELSDDSDMMEFYNDLIN